jgi:hypothetical protein
MIVPLLDISGSCFDAGQYPEHLEEIFGKLRPGDVVRIGLINDNPAATGRFLSFSLPVATAWDNDLRVAFQTKKALRRQYAPLVAMLASQRPSRQTSILDAVAAAASVIQAQAEPVSERYIILVSDGLEDSAHARFERRPPEAAQIQRILRAERARGLPSLAGIKIILWRPMRVQAPEEALRAASEFWAAYANEFGATLISSGPNALDALPDGGTLKPRELSGPSKSGPSK